MVEGLVLAGNFGVCLVQFAYKFYGIADGERRVSSEEVADGKVVGCPNRFVGALGKFLVKEQGSSLVGKNECDVRQVVSVFLYYIFSYIVKE